MTARSLPSAAWLVAQREVTMRLRSKAFLVSTGILLLAVLAGIVIGGIASATASDPKVAAVGTAQAVADRANGLDVQNVDSVAEARSLVSKGSVDAAIIPSTKTPLGYEVIADSSPPESVIAQLSVTPPVTLLDPPSQNGLLTYLVALGFGLVFFVSSITFGSTIAQSVIEEKQTRVVEILMTTIPVRALLAGKVLGNSILAFAQIAAIALLTVGGLLATGQTSVIGLIGPAIIWFVVFFAFGFILLAALFSAAASLVSRQEDAAAVTTPLTMLVMVPYLLVILFNSNALVLGVMSYVPFSAPVGMPMRIFLGTAEWWEPILSLAILLISTVLVIVLGARIYSNSLLRMGARVKLKDALAR